MNERLGARSTQWVESVLHSDVVHAQRLTGGWTSAMYLVRSARGEEHVLRLMDKEPWRTHGAALVGRERDVQTMLRGTGIPAPRSRGSDLTGEDAGHPAHLMSRLPGGLDLRRNDRDLLEQLAGALARIHAFEPPVRPRDFQSWAIPAKRVVPAWATRGTAWTAAFGALEAESPAFAGTFIHRDFHLGNVLWSEGEVTGVVDWVETSWGPAELDVAHCRTYLAMLHGPETASGFEEAYAARAADHDPGNQRHWDLLDIVGHLPDPVKVAQPWRDHGIEITDVTARTRLEQHLEAVLG
ncbi:hypothetical protein GCM10009844_06650 [Nocardioides koreensis]|uniref:Aminoglycoside phosphotransferase domain-containing protein n=1 Tax=Nocardioides koreensis TaxID=433651 RepID=A0ABP5KZP3_9ACTN